MREEMYIGIYTGGSWGYGGRCEDGINMRT